MRKPVDFISWPWSAPRALEGIRSTLSVVIRRASDPADGTNRVYRTHRFRVTTGIPPVPETGDPPSLFTAGPSRRSVAFLPFAGRRISSSDRIAYPASWNADAVLPGLVPPMSERNSRRVTTTTRQNLSDETISSRVDPNARSVSVARSFIDGGNETRSLGRRNRSLSGDSPRVTRFETAISGIPARSTRPGTFRTIEGARSVDRRPIGPRYRPGRDGVCFSIVETRSRRDVRIAWSASEDGVGNSRSKGRFAPTGSFIHERPRTVFDPRFDSPVSSVDSRANKANIVIVMLSVTWWRAHGSYLLCSLG